MAFDALDQSQKGASGQRCSWLTSAPGGMARSSATLVAAVRSLRASSLSLSRRSFASGWAGGNSRGRGTNYAESSSAHGETIAEVRKEQWPDHGSNRGRCLECIFPYRKKAWLSRGERTAHFKSPFPIHLIACSSSSSRRLTRFWFPAANARWACA